MNAPDARGLDSAAMTPAERDSLLANPALLRAALEFNGLCAPPDWGAESGLLAGSPRALLASHPRLWRYFPAPAQKRTAWCFESGPNRLALLPPPLLERLGLYWSAAVRAEDLARIIEKTRLSPIMAEIGAEVYRYAVRRGRFQLGGLRALLCREESASGRAWRVEAFRQPGDEMLSLCFARWPERLRGVWAERWRRPLPEAPARPAPVPFPALWSWLEKILLREVAPEWQPCFNS
jgi:hypothetical protein